MSLAHPEADEASSPPHEPSEKEIISRHARDAFRALVQEHSGCEVFAIGTIGESGCVDSLDPIAFGNWDSVPAPAQDASAGQVLIHNHPSGDLQPSDADINIASLYGKAGVGFYIVDNACERVRTVVRPFKPKKAQPIDVAALTRDFRPGGAIATAFSSYEHRSQQVEMLELVVGAFNESRIAVVEAGTGTGKSFAYLVPAIHWAVTNKQRVVVSTNTINLQEQLMEKDIPELRDRAGLKFKAVLIKGRGNYISRRRLEIAARDTHLFPDAKMSELQSLLGWSRKTEDGSRSDLPFEVSEQSWDAAMSDKDDCMRARCPHFDQCFFYKSRREAASADLVVSNHHLVMADIALKKDYSGNDFAAILPPFEQVVFDEAHHLEEVATSYFSVETSETAIRRQFARLQSANDPGKGALPRLLIAVSQADASGLYPSTSQILKLAHEAIPAQRMQADVAVQELFTQLFHKALNYFNIGQLGAKERREMRITSTVAQSPFWKEASEILGEIASHISQLLSSIEKCLRLINFYPEEVARELAEARMAVSAAQSKLAEHASSIEFFLQAREEEYCRWLEIGHFRDRPFIRPCAAPLDVAQNFQSALFAKKKTAVLTSATLTVNGKFDFIARQLGLAAGKSATSAPDDLFGQSPPSEEQQEVAGAVAARTDFLKLGTPFDYASNCLVGVTLDLPAPTDSQFDSATEKIIVDTVRITQGRAFILFTSYRSLERVYRAVSRSLTELEITPLRQGEMPRQRLLEVFRNTPRAALFATSSFWEGVDVQGSALECLILTRLPFRVPTNPILEARTERIDRNGGDSFRDLTIPLAVIRFKQGFGRLIRSNADRGTVLILDHRVSTKSYGKTFLRSLPPARVICDASANVLCEFERFHSGG